MPVPSLAVSPVPPAEWEGDVLVVGARSTKDGPELVPADGLDFAGIGLEGIDLASLGISGAVGDLARIPTTGAARSLAIIGLGGGTLTPDVLRGAAGALTRRIRGAAHIGFALPIDVEGTAEAVLEGAALGAYTYTVYRSGERSAAKAAASAVTLLTPAPVADEAVHRAGVSAEAVRLVKDLANMSPLDLFPEALADLAVAEAESAGVSAKVWDVDALTADGFGGILGVGQGSTRPPRLVKLTWAPAGATTTVALVGKGITFDSGGLSLKPPVPMVGMKYDMIGAATVLGVVVAAARLALPIGVTAWLCLAENMPSGSAIRPNDVLTIRGGTTVEVLNTDAEGRLVLADGLVAASEEQPDAIVDVATLTGAAGIALGTRYVGAMGDGDFIKRVQDASRGAGELVWHMPLPEELRTLLNSEIADIANVKPGNTQGGMLIAGQFLREFVGKNAAGQPIPWAHLDIAAAGSNGGSGWGYTGSGPTGAMVRTLIGLLRASANPAATAV